MVAVHEFSHKLVFHTNTSSINAIMMIEILYYYDHPKLKLSSSYITNSCNYTTNYTNLGSKELDKLRMSRNGQWRR